MAKAIRKPGLTEDRARAFVRKLDQRDQKPGAGGWVPKNLHLTKALARDRRVRFGRSPRWSQRMRESRVSSTHFPNKHQGQPLATSTAEPQLPTPQRHQASPACTAEGRHPSRTSNCREKRTTWHLTSGPPPWAICTKKADQGNSSKRRDHPTVLY